VRLAFVIATLLAASTVGCATEPTIPAPLSEPQAPVRDDSPAQTDSLIYRLKRTTGEYRAIVRVTYRNRTGAPVHFKRCNSVSVAPMFWFRRVGPDSTRRSFVDWAWACVGGAHTGLLAPDDSVTFSVPFGSVDQPLMRPPLQPEDLVGTFRVELSLCTRYASDSDYCDLSQQVSRQSNVFEIRY
jgi:hypothetical protein